MLPIQAVHPIIGGRAPTTDPTQVFAILIRFIGVYTMEYKSMLPAPIAAVNMLTWVASRLTPSNPATTPNVTPWDGLSGNTHNKHK